jgi:LCP family protein required for cell wall assembly
MMTADTDGRDLMNEWPEGWFRGEQGAGSPSGSDASEGADTVGIPAGPRAATPPGAWPDQPPLRSGQPGYGQPRYGQPGPAGLGARGGLAAPASSPARTGGPGTPASGSERWRRWLRPRRIFGVLVVVIALLLAGTVGMYFYLNSKLNRSDILVDYPGRPAPGVGTNWLIAGSDSRQGLTKAQERAYSTGFVSGGRSDTILILHIPAGGGRPILISIPRDSYVNIPGNGMDKINAAFSIGGPALLAKTIQSDTGLYINHFMDIGFGGFVRVVDAVGGVRMCLTAPLHDVASGVNLNKGCQTLSGGEALAYVRDRHSFTTQDLQREQDQRIFLKALLSKMTSPGVALDPFAALPAASGAVSALTVDQGTSLYDLIQVARAMRDPLTTTVPIATANYPTWAGDAVLWNSAQAKELFNDLQTGQAVPKSLITGSQQGS